MEICILNLIKIQFDHKMFQNSHPSWFNRLSLPKTYLLVLIKCVSTWLATFDCTVDICKRDNQKEVKSETWLFRVFFYVGTLLSYSFNYIISHTEYTSGFLPWFDTIPISSFPLETASICWTPICPLELGDLVLQTLGNLVS